MTACCEVTELFLKNVILCNSLFDFGILLLRDDFENSIIIFCICLPTRFCIFYTFMRNDLHYKKVYFPMNKLVHDIDSLFEQII